jgi:hypothetical protein
MRQALHQKEARNLPQVLQSKHSVHNLVAAEASCHHKVQGSLCHSLGNRQAPRWMVGQRERAELSLLAGDVLVFQLWYASWSDGQQVLGGETLWVVMLIRMARFRARLECSPKFRLKGQKDRNYQSPKECVRLYLMRIPLR